MKKQKMILAAFGLVMLPLLSVADTGSSRCAASDKICLRFEQFMEENMPEKVISSYDSAVAYSDDARKLAGEAYLAMASRDNISNELEESYYRKAIELKHNIAYMGLYFFYVQKDEKKAIGFLRDYVQTRPMDTVPFVILGEYELGQQNYELADTCLRMAKQVAHAHSPRVDWLLFKTNYILKNYAYAKEMFESAVLNGKFDQEIKALSIDPRFSDIGSRPEFTKYQNMLKVARSY